MKINLIALIFCLALGFPSQTFSFYRVELKDSLVQGTYHAEIKGYKGVPIPFQFQIKNEGKRIFLSLINGAEHLKSHPIEFFGDSILVSLPFFEAEFRLKKEGNHLNGYWVRYLPGFIKRYSLESYLSSEPRFAQTLPPNSDMTGHWEIHYNDKESHLPIGVFNQEKLGRVTGSILSVSGDDRFLDGQVIGDSLFLSTFDGAHAYLIKAFINRKSKTLDSGLFYAGSNPPSHFSAIFNPKAELDDVYSLTHLKKGIDTLGFSFKDLKGNDYSFPNIKTQNKIVIIQFLGSWCPNCMDETAFLTEFYKKNKDKVEIIGLAYERSNDWNLSRNSVQKLVNQFHVEYPVLVTGYKNMPDEVMKSIPQFDNYMAFPTMIIIDKKGKVQKIHTGFSGPGTGKYYKDFIQEFNAQIQELNSEN